MSRVSYVMLNPGSEKELTRAVRGCLAKLTAELAKAAGIERDGHPRDHARGQPGHAPPRCSGSTRPSSGARRSRSRRRGGPPARPRARAPGPPRRPRVRAAVHRRPRRRGHRGHDPLGGAAPRRGGQPDRRRRHERRDRARQPRRACSPRRARPGPAFEGAQITFGQRAAPGAIERVADRSRDARAALPRDRQRGMVGRAGVRGDTRHRHLRLGDHRGDRRALPRGRPHHGRHDRRSARRPHAAHRPRRPHASPTSCTTASSRSSSRRRTCGRSSSRKAALHAGCRLLLDRYGLERVDRIRLAGAFGSQIDPVHALVLGLVPDCDPAHVTPAGNAAGTGARIALLERAGAPRDRGRRPPGGEGRDRGRAALPGALRRRDGDPARRRSVRAAQRRRHPAAAPQGLAGRTGRAGQAPSSDGESGEEDRMSARAGRRGGGRAARQAARMQAVVDKVPFITRTLRRSRCSPRRAWR